MAVKILSVDDSKMIHSVIGKAFKNYNVELSFAINGVEGLAVATRENPDLIILDVTMPVMDGVETLTKLKADPVLKDIPVIMLTAEAGRENVIKIAKIGIRDYIIKPFTEQLVVERVGRVIDLQPKGGETKVKTFDDPANILVVEDKPAIIEQIKEAVAGTPWKVIGVSQCGEAIDSASKEIPDVILISLSLPDKAAHNFFQMIRANPRTKSVPIFGLSVKTASDEQAQAQAIGFNGIFTKPLDLNELNHRLTRAMNLDTSKRYFSQEGNIQIVKIPKDLNTSVAGELNAYIPPKLREMVESGYTKLLLDVSDVVAVDVTVIKIMLQVYQLARDLAIKIRVTGSSDFSNQAKAFEDTKDMEIYADRATALQGF